MNLPLLVIAYVLKLSGIPAVGEYIIKDEKEGGWITWWWTLGLIWALVPISIWTTNVAQAHRTSEQFNEGPQVLLAVVHFLSEYGYSLMAIIGGTITMAVASFGGTSVKQQK